MKNIKDITISIFAIIGFVFILSSFNNEKPDDYDRWNYQAVLGQDNKVYYSTQDKYTGEVYILNRETNKWKKRSYPVELGIYDSGY